jgi:UDP-N-acetylmuramoyl-L-alanyl-D-glutamate--2,6-diaminopimelate ligase
MKQGIATMFLMPGKHLHKGQKALAVIETDEANVAFVAKWLQAKYIVMTNLFRDQMDRYGEITTTYRKIMRGIMLRMPNIRVIANGDDPVFALLRAKLEKVGPTDVSYFGFALGKSGDEVQADPNSDALICPACKENVLSYHYTSYHGLGWYYCQQCGLERPKLTYAVTSLGQASPISVEFKVDGLPVKLHVGGEYNIYNALAAYSLARKLGITAQKATAVLSAADEQVFGRQEVVQIGDKAVTLILVKNPVGLDQVIKMIETDRGTYGLAVLLNANYADGIDTSWIWDGNFESLNFQQIPYVLAGGERWRDIAFRLKVAGAEVTHFEQAAGLAKVVAKIKTASVKRFYVLATYTAMLGLRSYLAKHNVKVEEMG